jgi:hypothetical protein
MHRLTFLAQLLTTFAVMLHTWQAGDCSAQAPYDGNFEKAMKGIKAKALVLPGQTDLYFP